MYLVMVALFKEEQLDDMLSVFAELGLENTVVLEATSMQEVLAFDVPIFAGLSAGSFDGKRYVKIVMSASCEEGIGRRIAKLARDLDIDFSERDVGFIVTWPITEHIASDD